MNTLARVYALRSPRTLYLHDGLSKREELLFHVRSQDYFGTAATIIALVTDALEAPGTAGSQKLWRNALDHLREDLVYLQETHCIVPKATRTYTRDRNSFQ